jgi:signal transduction histidine kinase
LKPEIELIVFRVIQELINNILKHSNSSFIHLTQNMHDGMFILRIHHDGRGIVQADFEKLNKSNIGLGLKNINSRLRVAQGKIFFEKDPSQTYYKVTMEIPKDDVNESLTHNS